MEKNLISFIILTYKNFDGICDTLDSVFAQDYPSIEIIISDDCSPNAEVELSKVRNYIEMHKTSNIKNVIIRSSETNQGTVKNINAAFSMANGEYIKDLGAEDTLNCPDALTKYKRFLDDSGCLICVSKLRGVDEQGKYHYNLVSCEDDYDSLRKMTPIELRNRLFVRNCLPAPGFFFKKELFLEYGYYPEDTRLIEDYPFWLYLCEKNVKFAFLDERLIDYKLTGVSSAGHYSRMFMEDMLIIYNKYIFPNDKRYGVLQPIYNMLKKAGLNTYIALSEWEDYSFSKKMLAVIKYFPFLIYINLEKRMHRG